MQDVDSKSRVWPQSESKSLSFAVPFASGSVSGSLSVIVIIIKFDIKSESRDSGLQRQKYTIYTTRKTSISSSMEL